MLPDIHPGSTVQEVTGTSRTQQSGSRSHTELCKGLKTALVGQDLAKVVGRPLNLEPGLCEDAHGATCKFLSSLQLGVRGELPREGRIGYGLQRTDTQTLQWGVRVHPWEWSRHASEVRMGLEGAQSAGLKCIWAGKELMLKFRTQTDTFCYQWEPGKAGGERLGSAA